jgi:hypothetical protein
MANRRKLLVDVAGGVLTGAGAIGRRLSARLKHRGGGDRWATVTVLRPVAEVEESEALAPLKALGSAVEISAREAPGGRGTELAARWSPGMEKGRSTDELRRLVREAKQVLEAGELLVATPRPEGARPPTLGGRFVDAAERRAEGTGVL